MNLSKFMIFIDSSCDQWPLVLLSILYMRLCTKTWILHKSIDYSFKKQKAIKLSEEEQANLMRTLLGTVTCGKMVMRRLQEAMSNVERRREKYPGIAFSYLTFSLLLHGTYWDIVQITVW